MKAESNVMPQHPFVIDRRGAVADITFFENAKETQKEDGPAWEYDVYALTVDDRPGLESTIEENVAAWREAAMAADGDSADSKRPLEEVVAEHDTKIVTLEETIDILYGGV